MTDVIRYFRITERESGNLALECFYFPDESILIGRISSMIVDHRATGHTFSRTFVKLSQNHYDEAVVLEAGHVPHSPETRFTNITRYDVPKEDVDALIRHIEEKVELDKTIEGILEGYHGIPVSEPSDVVKV